MTAEDAIVSKALKCTIVRNVMYFEAIFIIISRGMTSTNSIFEYPEINNFVMKFGWPRFRGDGRPFLFLTQFTELKARFLGVPPKEMN